MPGRATDPITIPASLWEHPQMTDALTSRDIRTVFHLVQRYAGASQTRIGIACGMSQGKVSETMKKAAPKSPPWTSSNASPTASTCPTPPA